MVKMKKFFIHDDGEAEMVRERARILNEIARFSVKEKFMCDEAIYHFRNAILARLYLPV